MCACRYQCQTAEGARQLSKPAAGGVRSMQRVAHAVRNRGAWCAGRGACEQSTRGRWLVRTMTQLRGLEGRATHRTPRAAGPVVIVSGGCRALRTLPSSRSAILRQSSSWHNALHTAPIPPARAPRWSQSNATRPSPPRATRGTTGAGPRPPPTLPTYTANRAPAASAHLPPLSVKPVPREWWTMHWTTPKSPQRRSLLLCFCELNAPRLWAAAGLGPSRATTGASHLPCPLTPQPQSGRRR